MPRKKRAKAKSGIYHVMLRGINKQNVFLDDDDYMTMMRCLADLHLKRDGLGKIVSKSECSVLAENFALRVPPFHSCGTVRLTLMVPLISVVWYQYHDSKMSAVKRCSLTAVA